MDTFKRCITASSNTQAQKICVSIIMAVDSRSHLDAGNVIGLASIINATPVSFQTSALAGLSDSYFGIAKTNPALPTWDTLCDALQVPDIRAACSSYD